MRGSRSWRGAYAVGHRPAGDEARWMAAVLACGPGAALTGYEGARLWGLLRGRPGRLEILVPRGRRAREGARAVSARRIERVDVTTCRGIPVASVAMVLMHLAADPAANVKRALAQAQFLRLYDGRAVRALIERSAGRPGAAELRRLTHEDAFTETELEERFLSLVRRAGVPRPMTQYDILLGPDDPVRVDFAWPERGLVVETDGREGHITPAAFEEDRRRDAALTALGWRVARFTWRQVRDGDGIAATLRTLLA